METRLVEKVSYNERSLSQEQEQQAAARDPVLLLPTPSPVGGNLCRTLSPCVTTSVDSGRLRHEDLPLGRKVLVGL